MGPDIESFREILVNDIIGLQKQEFSPRFKIIIIFIKMAQNSSYLKSTQLIKINSKLFVEKKPFLFDVLFIAGMFAKTSFLIYLIVLIAVASSFVSVALTWKISISQLCCCCLRNGGFISKKWIFTSYRQKLQLWLLLLHKLKWCTGLYYSTYQVNVFQSIVTFLEVP